LPESGKFFLPGLPPVRQIPVKVFDKQWLD
jgi:hypothetical protein